MNKHLFLALVAMSFGASYAEIDEALAQRVDFLQGKTGLATAAKRGAKIGAGVGAVVGAVGLGAGLAVDDYSRIKKDTWRLRLIPFYERFEIPQPSGKRARIGAIGVLGAGMGAEHGAIVGAPTGAVIGTGYAAANRKWIQYRINKTLQNYTSLSFQELSRDQAILIYAAYLGNLLVMQEALSLPGAMEFFKQPGVSQVIAELYLGSASDEKVTSLLELLDIK